jgi:Protein of unknown function (DUF3551)
MREKSEEASMRAMALSMLVLATALTVAPRPSEARYNYPWCAQYFDAGSVFSCAFVTYEQCLASVRGVGGLCMQNPAGRFHPRRVEAGRGKPRRHSAHHKFRPVAAGMREDAHARN